MRISDWSSDVCSSDLYEPHRDRSPGRVADDLLPLPGAEREQVELFAVDAQQAREKEAAGGAGNQNVAVERACPVALDAAAPDFVAGPIVADRRGNAHRRHILARPRGQRLLGARSSEELTSELQSTMRNS